MKADYTDIIQVTTADGKSKLITVGDIVRMANDNPLGARVHQSEDIAKDLKTDVAEIDLILNPKEPTKPKTPVKKAKDKK